MMALTAAVVVAAAPVLAQEALPVRILFATDSDTLTAAGRAELDKVAAQVGDGQVVIAGHADASDGDESYAIGLSHRRANAVRDYLVARGVNPGDTVVMAYGRSRPITTARAGAGVNRRVEVTIGPGSGW